MKIVIIKKSNKIPNDLAVFCDSSSDSQTVQADIGKNGLFVAVK